MTAAEFKKKWSRYQGKETSAYQAHFDDLCRLLGQPSPTEADPSGNDFFCYQKRVVKDAELLGIEHPDCGDPTEHGFADVWRKDCFGWEYKGKKKSLGAAYQQLLRYREALLNPPLLAVCDFDRYIIRTNFNGTVQETYEFTNDQIDCPENLRILRALFENPEFLKPQRTTAQVTQVLAEKLAQVARSLQKRESAELADAQTRAEVSVAQRRNLRIARFLNRLIFCFFAEDTGLLPKNLFSDLARTALDDPRQFSQTLESLFRTMATGGMFGPYKIRHFNGHLFEDSTVFELNDEERRILAEASEADWQSVEPSIMGTLFARGLDPDQLAALGAQYTGRPDIVALVEPVLMAPLRREWAALKDSLLSAFKRGKGTPGERARIQAFLKKLRKLVVMDPACGSGNFLYVSLQMLLDIEKEVITFALMLDFPLTPEVGVQQLRAIEINPYAYELAQVTVQIGYLQWRRDNGFDNDRAPVLQNLDGFHNEDALLVPHFHNKARTLKEAQADEHTKDTSLKFYTERQWPKADVIVGNPPFLGGSRIWEELGREYQQELWRVYEGRVPGFADLCCYWFEKARKQIADGNCKRVGLLATQGIRGGANREVLKRIKESGDIFFAESDRDWVLAGANVHVSMIGFDGGEEKHRTLDGLSVPVINANLTSTVDVTQAKPLSSNLNISFIGTKKAGDFNIEVSQAVQWLHAPNPDGRSNSDILKPWLNGSTIVKRTPVQWIIDCGTAMTNGDFALYPQPYRHVLEHVKPDREKNNRPLYREKWWLHAETRPGMREAVSPLQRYLATPRVSKYRIFVWVPQIVICDDGVFLFARADDYFFGILHSRLHEVWGLKLGTRLETRPRYTPTTCFETFPFPFLDDLQPLKPALLKPPPKSEKPPEPDRTYAENLAAKNYFMGKEESPPYRSVSRREDAHPTDSAPRAPHSALDHRVAIGAAAKELNDLRERWLNPPEWTVERILEFPGSADGPWSRYVVNPDNNSIGTVRYPRLEPRDADCAAQLKQRTQTNLYNQRPTWLDLAHKKLDAAVAAAYRWPADLSDEQILERLLALNLERAAAEAASLKQPKSSRSKHADELI